jgi:putative membrane protein
MRRNNPVESPSRQSPLAILMLILQFARNILRQFWPVALLLLLNRQRSEEFGFLLAVAGLSFFSMLGSVLSWFRFYYWMDENHLFVNKGIFARQKLQIPFERIQAIKLEQNVFQQAFHIAKIEIETAGAKGSELTIHALPMELAHQIRSFIFSRKEEKNTAAVDHASDSGEIGEPQKSYEGTPLFSLPFSTLVKIGISQNHLRTLFLVLFFLVFSLDQGLETMLPDEEEIDLEQVWSQWGFWFNLTAFAVFFVVIVLVSVGYGIGQTVFRYADFVVYKTQEGLRIVGGLLNRMEQVVVRRKIQLVVLDTNPVRRLLGLQRVRFFQASGDAVSLNESIYVPGCSAAQADQLLQEYVDPEQLRSLMFSKVQPAYAIRFFLLSLLLPLIGLTAAAVIRFGWQSMWLLSITPFLAWFAWAYYSRLEYAISSDFMVVKRGVFYRSTTIIKLYKIQAVTVFQSFYERRRGNLGTVIVHSAARKVVIPFLELDQARFVADVLCKKVETARKHWI